MEARTQFDRLPPNDPAAEICAIGALMLAGSDDRLFEETRRLLGGAGSFYSPDNAIIFRAIEAAKAAGNVDAVTVREELARRQVLDDVGGIDYLGRILNSLPSAAYGPHYAKIVRAKALMRDSIAAANDVIRSCYSPADHDNAIEIAQAAARRFAALSSVGM